MAGRLALPWLALALALTCASPPPDGDPFAAQLGDISACQARCARSLQTPAAAAKVGAAGGEGGAWPARLRLFAFALPACRMQPRPSQPPGAIATSGPGAEVAQGSVVTAGGLLCFPFAAPPPRSRGCEEEASIFSAADSQRAGRGGLSPFWTWPFGRRGLQPCLGKHGIRA